MVTLANETSAIENAEENEIEMLQKLFKIVGADKKVTRHILKVATTVKKETAALRTRMAQAQKHNPSTKPPEDEITKLLNQNASILLALEKLEGDMKPIMDLVANAKQDAVIIKQDLIGVRENRVHLRTPR